MQRMKNMNGKRLEGFHSLDESAEILGVTRQYMFKLIKTGKIQPYHVGQIYILADEELDRFVKTQQENNTTLEGEPDGRYKIK